MTLWGAGEQGVHQWIQKQGTSLWYANVYAKATSTNLGNDDEGIQKKEGSWKWWSGFLLFPFKFNHVNKWKRWWMYEGEKVFFSHLFRVPLIM